MQKAQLYLSSDDRTQHLSLHTFYVEQMKTRILSQFDDLEEEAQRHGNATYERLGRLPGHGDIDMIGIAEVAYDEGLEHYLALSDLRKQVLLGGLAGMFHQWDKAVRQHLEYELRRDFDRDWIEREIWNSQLSKLINIFEKSNWPIKSLPCYSQIGALQLVVNVYKHGKGRSLSELSADYGEYVENPLQKLMPNTALNLDHKDLTVTDDQFGEFADAIRDFWEAMPERLFLDITPPST